MKKIILASGSPRRRELLQMLNIPFEVKVSDVEEIVPVEHDATPADRVKYLSLIKSRAVAAEVENDTIVIGSDTVVAKDNDILNKPVDKEDARRMLHDLSGRSHHVYTGLSVIVKEAGHCTGFGDEFMHIFVNLLCAYAGFDCLTGNGSCPGGYLTGLTHQFDFSGGFDSDCVSHSLIPKVLNISAVVASIVD